MTVGAKCNIPACAEERLRGHLFCWSHQIDLELIQIEEGGIPGEDDPGMLWVCSHGSVLGDCFLAEVHEFPGLGATPWQIRVEMAGLSFGFN